MMSLWMTYKLYYLELLLIHFSRHGTLRPCIIRQFNSMTNYVFLKLLYAHKYTKITYKHNNHRIELPDDFLKIKLHPDITHLFGFEVEFENGEKRWFKYVKLPFGLRHIQ